MWIVCECAVMKIGYPHEPCIQISVYINLYIYKVGPGTPTSYECIVVGPL